MWMNIHTGGTRAAGLCTDSVEKNNVYCNKYLFFLHWHYLKQSKKKLFDCMAFNGSLLTCHCWFSVVACASSYLYLISAGRDEYVFFLDPWSSPAIDKLECLWNKRKGIAVKIKRRFRLGKLGRLFGVIAGKNLKIINVAWEPLFHKIRF